MHVCGHCLRFLLSAYLEATLGGISFTASPIDYGSNSLKKLDRQVGMKKRNDRSLRNLAIRDSTTYCIHLTSIFLLYRSYVRNVPRVFVTTRRVSLYARKEGQHYRFNIILLYSLVLCIYSLNASGGGIEQWCEASDREHITLAYFFHRRKKTT